MKTVILNNQTDNDFKAVLSLKEKEKSVIKFFNLKNLNKALALGIKQDKKIVKIPLSVEDGKSEFSLSEYIDFSKNVLCAVVDVSNAFCPEILLSGSNNSLVENIKIEDAFVRQKPKDASVLYAQDNDEKIDNIIDNNLEDDLQSTYYDGCARCRYRESFYSGCRPLRDSEILTKKSPIEKVLDENDFEKIQNENQNKHSENPNENQNENQNEQDEHGENQNEKEDSSNEESQKDFYEQVKEQLNALFEKYPQEEHLSKIIPHSKWAKVTYDGGDDFYVLGLIYDEDNTLKYISYGVPSPDNTTPPDDLRDFAQWLPKDVSGAQSEGYWMVCQDAKSGETLKFDLV